jgi:putative Holliday junction resolvase
MKVKHKGIMMRIAALDLGDVWVGIALSDPLKIISRPYGTVKLIELNTTLQKLIDTESVTEVIVGEPQTLRGTVSEQTKKIHEQFDELKNQFPQIIWHLWDERLTSKQASTIQKGRSLTKLEAKTWQHAIAAALILRSYLDHLEWKKQKKAGD